MAKKGHLAKEYKDPKVQNPSTSFVHVLSCTFIIESNSLWVMDSSFIDHILRDCDLFVHFHKISQGTKFVYQGNNVILEVREIGTCKVLINKWKNLVLIDYLYVLMIQRNLVPVTCLLHFCGVWFNRREYNRMESDTKVVCEWNLIPDIMCLVQFRNKFYVSVIHIAVVWFDWWNRAYY